MIVKVKGQRFRNALCQWACVFVDCKRKGEEIQQKKRKNKHLCALNVFGLKRFPVCVEIIMLDGFRAVIQI